MKEISKKGEFAVERNKKSNELIIVFTARDTKGSGKFDFFNSLNNYEHNKFFFRDVSNKWYLYGVNEISSTHLGFVKYLQNFINKNKITNIITIGSSAGGFAAILYGMILKANKVIAFSPQTCITNAFLKDNQDDRWIELLSFEPVEQMDTAHFLNKDTELYLYSCKNKYDMLHAKYLLSKHNKTYHKTCKCEQHSVSKYLNSITVLDLKLRRIILEKM